MMKLVYRVEDQKGVGPYQWAHNNTISKAMANLGGCNMTKLRPRPSDDGIKTVSRDHYFGFKTIGQLQQWFPPSALKLLAKGGLYTSVYEVDDQYIVFGNKQLVFERQYARLIERNENEDFDSDSFFDKLITKWISN